MFWSSVLVTLHRWRHLIENVVLPNISRECRSNDFFTPQDNHAYQPLGAAKPTAPPIYDNREGGFETRDQHMANNQRHPAVGRLLDIDDTPQAPVLDNPLSNQGMSWIECPSSWCCTIHRCKSTGCYKNSTEPHLIIRNVLLAVCLRFCVQLFPLVVTRTALSLASPRFASS